MHGEPGMNTRRLEEGSRLVGATSWAAIASGVFVALALQTVLLLLGLAFGLSVGDQAVGGGYALWAVLVQLASIAVGAALAAAVTHAERGKGGMVAGIMTWAVALVIGGALSWISVGRMVDGAGAWSGFVGAVLGLGAGIIGGMFGASLGSRSSGSSFTSQDRTDRSDPMTMPPIG
jgi:hypothetical protein